METGRREKMYSRSRKSSQNYEKIKKIQNAMNSDPYQMYNSKEKIKKLCDGYECIAGYIENILDLEHDLIKLKVIKNSILKTNPKVIVKLIEELKKMEEYVVTYDQLHYILELAREVLNGDPDHRWISEQIFTLLIEFIQSYLEQDVTYKIMAFEVKYHYADFLVRYGLYKEAFKILNTVIQDECWFNEKVELTLLGNNIYNLLAICCMENADIEKGLDLEKEMEYAGEACKYAYLCSNHQIIARASLSCAEILLKKNQIVQALIFLDECISSAEKILDKSILCKCYMEKAQIFYRETKFELAKKYAQKVISIAEENNLPIYAGKALTLLAKWYGLDGHGSSKGNENYEKASIYLGQALEKFLSIGHCENLILETRVLYGLMMYNSLVELYFQLIESISIEKVKNYEKHKHLLNLLIKWKDERIPFWTKNVKGEFVLREQNYCEEN